MGFAGREAGAERASVPEVDSDADMVVYLSPFCGCCGDWVKHIEEHGLSVERREVSDVTPIKQAYGITRELASCHTGIIDGYAIEGHVPAEDIKRLLEERPDVAGLTVPGMPIGSPGMEVEGVAPDAYDVLTFDRDGTTAVFASHN
ncbi:hypothetical protein CAI21_15540 [Alkalilimnicola ehrlichii]|uniref:Metal-binding protein n=2 Tax=Alkalilimnicola ehrlichii TaxID=351052 RepID=A0A3E0WP31_9GAMM|nr:hypothetical protein CAI21_15540 [Alkalilimnicola ehrlichii]RFA34159.1 hypothetical protein CAL65_15675 [Alkalilimnicola ehrlichii]